MGIQIKATVAKAVDLSFTVFAELLKSATFKKVVSFTPDPFTGANVNVYASAPVSYLPLVFSTQDADGSAIVYGDEKWLVKASELSTISPISSSGDTFDANGSHYDVKAALLDVTDNLWTFQVRRLVPAPIASSPDQDFGDLSLFDSSDDWGTVADLNDDSDDWNIEVPDVGPTLDYGDFDTPDETSEDWDDLTAYDSAEDWNNS